MEWIVGLDFVNVANGVLVLVTGLAMTFGFRSGRRKQPDKREDTVAVAGALVDSGSVREMAAAMEAQTLEMTAARIDNEKLRKVGHEMIEAVQGLAKEVMELRSEMRAQR